ncbi:MULTISPECIES: YchJ family protein [unclassified Kitasatospora]|uniref:YchJ family protein n=1 Tax=unclassified Kitasatospora TaxID=2633591 RepID=UPI003805BFA4
MARRRTPAPAAPAAPADCPCGLPARYADCCGRLHRGEAAAGSAEQLMRSRFSAFAVHDEPYLLRSWHPDTRPAAVDFDPALRWERLEILGSGEGGPFHTEGTVEFRAHYLEGGRPGALHERSRFVRHRGEWVYLDGDTTP